MLERVDYKEMQDDRNRWFERAQAHEATIADLQGQIAVERANKESAVACVDRDVKKISALQQRVAQLEGEKQEYMQAATNEPLNEPLTYGALKAARFVAKRAFQELVKARADHARVLGLLAQVTEIADMMLKGTECEHDVGLCSCEHRRIVKQAQRSLPAQPAQGGAHG